MRVTFSFVTTKTVYGFAYPKTEIKVGFHKEPQLMEYEHESEKVEIEEKKTKTLKISFLDLFWTHLCSLKDLEWSIEEYLWDRGYHGVKVLKVRLV